jgi:hypothetical protein
MFQRCCCCCSTPEQEAPVLILLLVALQESVLLHAVAGLQLLSYAHKCLHI